jgi:hypothetical protein
VAGNQQRERIREKQAVRQDPSGGLSVRWPESQNRCNGAMMSVFHSAVVQTSNSKQHDQNDGETSNVDTGASAATK